jgi:hypothetical protein
MGAQGKEMIRHVLLVTIMLTVLCHANYIILTEFIYKHLGSI